MTDIVERLRDPGFPIIPTAEEIRLEAAAEIERLRAVTVWAIDIARQADRHSDEIAQLNAEIERLREQTRSRSGYEYVTTQQEMVAEIERLRAALADVLPFAERYVGRSDGQPDHVHDKLFAARAILAALEGKK